MLGVKSLSSEIRSEVKWSGVTNHSIHIVLIYVKIVCWKIHRLPAVTGYAQTTLTHFVDVQIQRHRTVGAFSERHESRV